MLDLPLRDLGIQTVVMFARWSTRPRDQTLWAGSVVAHALATWFMVGLIWTVHHVHYPLFAEVGSSEYVEFQSEHVRRIGMVLAAPWLVEGLATLGVLLLARRRREIVAALVSATAAGGVLLVSGLASAPAHGELADGFDALVHDRLMAWNLVRALLWTAKGVVSAVLLWWLVVDRRHGSVTTGDRVTPSRV